MLPKWLLENCRRPRGFVGRIIVKMMNRMHSLFMQEVLESIEIKPDHVVFDIGCGGGWAIANMAARGAEVYGIDYSEVSIRQAKRKNHAAIQNKRVHIEQADVAQLAFHENMFDLVTAFETIYFWENIADRFRSVHGILKPGGQFLIAVEAYKENDQIINFPKAFHKLELNIFSFEQLQDLLSHAGFVDISMTKISEKRGMAVFAFKSHH